MIRLADFLDKSFGEGDHVIFSDRHMSLRKAKVRAIKEINGGGYMVALEIVAGKDFNKKRYSRAYYPHDFMKVDE